MKGTFRIGGAVFVGVLMILGAFYVQSRPDLSGNDALIIASAPERTAIPTKDTDGDGIEDWEEALTLRTFKEITAPTGTPITIDGTPYEAPTTLTGKFSEAFFQDYLEGKIKGEDFSDPTAFVQNAVKAIEANTESKVYTPLDIVAVPTEEESVRTYGNDIARIIFIEDTAGNPDVPMALLEEALKTNNPELLTQITPVLLSFESMIARFLATPVPSELRDEHLKMLNAYEAMALNIRATRLAFTDPVFTLARVQGYQTDIENLKNGMVEVIKAIQEYEIIFEDDEPGAFFYKLRV